MERDSNKISATGPFCPVTGLKIFQKPEWRDIPIGKDYSLTLTIIEKNILLAQSKGYGRRKDAEEALKYVRQVLSETLEDGESYIHVSDYSRLKGASIAARKYYMDYFKNHDRVKCMIIFGAMPLVKMSIKIVKRISRNNYDVEVVDNYQDAMKLAADKLREIRNLSTGDTPHMLDSKTRSPSKIKTPKKMIGKADWNLQMDGFSILFEVFEDNIIHTVSKGFLREEHVEPLHRLRREVIDSIHSPEGTYSIIANVSGVRGATRKARRMLTNSLRETYKERPFERYIFYGVNWFTRTALNLGSPFLAFKGAAVKDLEAAMRIVHEGKSRASLDHLVSIQKNGSESIHHGNDIKQYVDDLIHYIGGIDWDREGVEFTEVIDPTHPFTPVFDSISFIKGELDDLFQERDRIERKLKVSQERYRTILQSIEDGYFEVDLTGTFTFANDSMARILGYSRDQIIGMNNREYMDEENAAKVYRVFNQVFKTGLSRESFDWQITLKDGSIKFLEASVSCIKDSTDQTIGFRGIVRDITTRKKAELALKRSEENYRQLFFSEADAIIIVDLKTRKVVDANPSALSLYKCDLNKMIGLNILDISAEPEKTSRHIEPMAKGTEPAYMVRETHRKLDGTVFPVEISHGFYNRHDGKMLCTIIRDITSQKEAEEFILKSQEELENRVKERTKQLAQANKDLNQEIKFRRSAQEETLKAKEIAENANRAKSEFLANMSHELRTPLNHIIGFTELVIDKTFGDLNKVQEEYLNDVHYSSMHLLSLINDILDLSKVEAGKLIFEPSSIELRTILENSLIMVMEKAVKHGIQLSTDIKEIPKVITADERKLKQILYNLLFNAVKFTPDGGKVLLKADLVDGSLPLIDGNTVNSINQKLEKISNKQKGSQEYIRISVTDNGIGIKPEDLELIFSPFEQAENSPNRRYQGTGLGLSLTKSLVELHGGRIWAESKGEGKGSTFSLILPNPPRNFRGEE
jgi:PAS domain S-box-containing protein